MTIILFVEDDADDRDFFTLALTEVNPNAVLRPATNGQEAIEILSTLDQSQLPCVIVLDLNMPVMDGYQTLRALEGQPAYAAIPKVILSTSDLEENKRKCLSHGAADYLVKPAEIKKWAGTVHTILNFCS